ncbi:hypothetical protein AB1N83_013871 [Pleurotus pulmonarius]
MSPQIPNLMLRRGIDRQVPRRCVAHWLAAGLLIERAHCALLHREYRSAGLKNVNGDPTRGGCGSVHARPTLFAHPVSIIIPTHVGTRFPCIGQQSMTVSSRKGFRA